MRESKYKTCLSDSYIYVYLPALCPRYVFYLSQHLSRMQFIWHHQMLLLRTQLFIKMTNVVTAMQMQRCFQVSTLRAMSRSIQ